MNHLQISTLSDRLNGRQEFIVPRQKLVSGRFWGNYAAEEESWKPMQVASQMP